MMKSTNVTLRRVVRMQFVEMVLVIATRSTKAILMLAVDQSAF